MRTEHKDLLVLGAAALERAAVHVLECEVGGSLELEAIVHGDEIGVVELAQHAQLVEEGVPLLPCVARHMHNFERKQPACRSVAREAHGPTRTSAELVQRLYLVEGQAWKLTLSER